MKFSESTPSGASKTITINVEGKRKMPEPFGHGLLLSMVFFLLPLFVREGSLKGTAA
jgi:hypothetical protein